LLTIDASVPDDVDATFSDAVDWWDRVRVGVGVGDGVAGTLLSTLKLS
jgi:hypothetical protein